MTGPAGGPPGSARSAPPPAGSPLPGPAADRNPTPQGIAEFVPQVIAACACTAACRPGQPVGGDGPLGLPPAASGPSGCQWPRGLLVVQAQHAIQPATPGLEPGQAWASSRERVMAPRPSRPVRISSSWRQARRWRPLGESSEPEQGEGQGRAQTRDAGFMMSSLCHAFISRLLCGESVPLLPLL